MTLDTVYTFDEQWHKLACGSLYLSGRLEEQQHTFSLAVVLGRLPGLLRTVDHFCVFLSPYQLMLEHEHRMLEISLETSHPSC